MKLNLGCGNDIRQGWVNVDSVSLPGVDRIHDLDSFPYPFEDREFDEVAAKDVLEHLDKVIPVLEEMYRIMKPGAELFIEVPFWNSWRTVSDPTHKRGFNEIMWEFFDPDKERCKLRPYYSIARFRIVSIDYYIEPFGPHYSIRGMWIRNRWIKPLLKILSTYFPNIVTDLQVRLIRT